MGAKSGFGRSHAMAWNVEMAAWKSCDNCKCLSRCESRTAVMILVVVIKMAGGELGGWYSSSLVDGKRGPRPTKQTSSRHATAN